MVLSHCRVPSLRVALFCGESEYLGSLEGDVGNAGNDMVLSC